MSDLMKIKWFADITTVIFLCRCRVFGVILLNLTVHVLLVILHEKLSRRFEGLEKKPSSQRRQWRAEYASLLSK